jgi:hypothetical protein
MQTLRWMAFLLAAAPLGAETDAMPESQRNAAAEVEVITIPTPGEFFTAMDKVGRPPWAQMLVVDAPPDAEDRAQIALLLGELVADGYIAVEAQDGQAVKNVGKEILDLAKSLNVGERVLGRASSIADFAENNDWNALREELEATQNEVKLTLRDQKDDDLVSLITVGAWIRGTQLVSSHIAAHYAPEAARLLRQPAIMEFLMDRIAALPERIRDTPLVTEISSGLKQARAAVEADTPSPENVQTLANIMTALTKRISTLPENP